MSEQSNTISIDGKKYNLDTLNDTARAQIVNLRLVDQEIARLQNLLAISQTARATYARALTEQLTNKQ